MCGTLFLLEALAALKRQLLCYSVWNFTNLKARGVAFVNALCVFAHVLSGRTAGTSVRRGQGCPMPDTLQGTAVLGSEDGGTYGKAYVRKGKKSFYERNSPAVTKVREQGGGGVPGARSEISLQPVVKTVVRQLSPCNQWKRQW